jgi:Wiskott-Aldrich syndrome protein
MIGFVFADEGEAKTFHKKVKNQKNGKADKPKSEKKKKLAADPSGKLILL